MEPGEPAQGESMTDTVERIDWPMHLCYGDGWTDQELVPEAFAHPAKAAKGLLRLIFDDLFRRGELKKGDTVIDPFGGIGSTGIEATSRGCRAVCCELEEKFYRLMLENFELHRRTWLAAGDPLPVAVLGDSRNLAALMGPALADAAVSSPPYVSSLESGGEGPGAKSPGDRARYASDESYQRSFRRLPGGDGVAYGTTPGQLGALPPGTPPADAAVSSPPYAETSVTALNKESASGGQGNAFRRTGKSPRGRKAMRNEQYADTPGQLGALPPGEAPLADAAVSSPPFLDARSETTPSIKGNTPTRHDPESWGATPGQLGALPPGQAPQSDCAVSSPPFSDAKAHPSLGDLVGAGGDLLNHCTTGARPGDERYGTAPGQLGALPPGEAPQADCAISSPPYAESLKGDNSEQETAAESRAKRKTPGGSLGQSQRHAGYGSDGNLGNTAGATFWDAARIIVRQTWLCLKDGAMTAWIVKSYVKNKKVVPFPEQWAALLAECGFVVERVARAWLVQEAREPGLFEAEVVTRKERKSFFRRLAEKKGSPRIDYEVVLFARKVSAS
jgi:hypothetical protein